MLARASRKEGHGAGSGILEAPVVAQGLSKTHAFDPTWIWSAGFGRRGLLMRD